MSRPAFTPERAFEIDREATERYGIPSILLMENAGRAAADEAVKLGSGPVGILIGKGKNGGDGMVVARTLHARGFRVRLYTVFDLAPRGDVLTNFEMIQALGLKIERGLPELHPVLVDAVFGIGLTREIEGPAREAIETLNRHHEAGAKVLAVDVPSGLDARTGEARGAAVRADVTVTMGFLKTGFLKSGSTEYTGNVVVAEIGYPPDLIR